MRVLFLLIFLVVTSLNTQAQKWTQQEFKEQAENMLKELSTYLEIISSKNSKVTDVNNSIKLAKQLFLDENQIMQVSSCNSPEIRNYKIPLYLNKLKALPYTKVEMKWQEVIYVDTDDIELGAGGIYEATVSIVQTFIGYRGDGTTYEDTTIKNVIIKMKQESIQDKGKSVGVWKVYLGGISVDETRGCK